MTLTLLFVNLLLHRLRWAGHLVRIDLNRAPRKLFENDPEGRRGVGRPKTRWIDGVQADLKALGKRNETTLFKIETPGKIS